MASIYTNLLTNALSFDSGVGGDGKTVAGDRVITKQIQRFLNMQDSDYPSGFASADEIQTLPAFLGPPTSGNFTITITLRNGDTCTTANLAYNANQATILAALNTACTGNITDWTNGDITVALTGNLTANDATLTYDGDSVTETKQAVAVMTDVDLAGGSVGALTSSPQGVTSVNEIQSIAAFNGPPTGGNYTLTINLDGEAPFTTASILYNADAATVETAINTEGTANGGANWVNGDVSVACTDNLTANAMAFTYDGANTGDANQGEIVLTDVDLSGGSTGAVSTTTPGVVAVNEVQTIAAFVGPPTGGNYTLTINLDGEAAFTTASILYNASAATVETAIDTEGTANGGANWVNADVSVACTDNLSANTMTFTYDGTNTSAKNHTEILITDVDLTGGTLGAVSTTTPGVVAVNEVQTIAVFNGPPTGGNYTLTINLDGEAAFTTDSILYNASAATVETAIDTEGTANGGANWVNADISVACTDNLTANTMTFTYDGTNTSAKNHTEILITDVDLSGGDIGVISTPTPGVVPVDEVQTVTNHNGVVTSGNFTLTINLDGESAVTTASILFDAVEAGIQSAIDVVCTGNIGGWTNGDIDVALTGNLDVNDATLTYNGTSVAGANHVLVLQNDVDLGGGGTVGTPADSVNGVAGVDEIQQVLQFPIAVDGGNYSLTINLAGEAAFTTANITYNDNAATVEGIIDTEGTANGGANWVNGDVTVACTDNLTANTMTFTYDGTNTSEKDHTEILVTDVDLSGGQPGTIATSPEGVVPVDEIQEIAAYGVVVDSGSFTLTVNLSGEAAFTTANIAYDASAATVETAIDTEGTANGGANWVNADVSVACTDNLTANAMTFTYDGTNTTGKDHTEILITDVDLSGGQLGAIATSPEGVVPVDEVQEIAAHGVVVTGGNFTLTVNLSGEAAFTTANLAYDAAAAAVETAIDTEGTANGGANWVNADVSVACTDNLSANAMTFTYDGTNTTGKDHTEILITDVDLAGGQPGAISTSPQGVVPVDEIQSFAIYPISVSSGNYTLEFTLNDATNFTTANIEFDSNAAQVEAIIDTEATANGAPAWTNGDITVSGGPLTTAPLVLTFDGGSVDEGNHSDTALADVDLKGGEVSTVTVATQGQTDRTGLAVLQVMGLIDSTPPAQGTSSGITALSTRASNPYFPSEETLKALAQQVAMEDGMPGQPNDDIYVDIMTAFDLTRLLN